MVTGANAATGRALLGRAVERGLQVVAAVRSERAERELGSLPGDAVRVARIDYADPASLRAACSGALGLVHVAGILFESAHSDYESAHQGTTQATLGAARAAGIAKYVLISAVGADARSTNRFFRSKGEAEALALESGLPACALRAPLVLGCGSAGDAMLARRARAPIAFVPGLSVVHQPIDARDLADAAVNAALEPARGAGHAFDVVGRETLTLRELIARAARVLGTTPRTFAVPKPLAALAARLAGAATRHGMNATVFEVLNDDCRCDPAPAERALGHTARPLDDTLRAGLAALASEETS